MADPEFDADTIERAFASDQVRQELKWGPRELQLGLDWVDGFDKKFGTDTRGIDFDTPPGTYVPTLPRMFEHILSRIDVPLETFTFVDIGSGKGRAVMLAAMHPFKRCFGLELSPVHCATSKKNAEIFRASSECRSPLDFVCADATTFDYPKEDLFVWLYNPFGNEITAKFLERLGQSLEESPRKLLLVYGQQHHQKTVDAAPFMKPKGEQGGPCTIPLVVKDGVYPYSVYANF